MDKAKQYLEEYRNLSSSQEKATLMARYQAFLQTLSVDEREHARQFMQTQLRSEIKKNVSSLDALSEQADLLLKNPIYQ
ncbi:hypothetical protein [Spirosoma spitsbergense]|jgi:hypothetical protein|uniref:hypothetical protein n=1 Tax=Spirosoma spitsbergense TaxID=431554 RepID=UPI000373FA0E|nr:hypothetical protein [Spirosoma spitsbergense]